MPGSFQSNAGNGVPNVVRSMPPVRSFSEPAAPFEYPFAIALTAVDSNGNPVSGATILLFRTADDSLAGVTTCDANGNFRVSASPALTHFVVAYDALNPDIAGTTVNTLVGT